MTCIYIIMGPPGAGKGTQMALLKKDLSVAVYSTGDLLRKEIKDGSELGKQVFAIMNSGQLVDEKFVNKIILHSLQNTQKKMIFLDGYPRTVSQAKFLSNNLSNNLLKALIHVTVPAKDLEQRICGRRVCEHCNRIFNIYTDTIINGKCLNCKSLLSHRKDDALEQLKVRLSAYNAETLPLIQYYKNIGVYYGVDGAAASGIVQQKIRDIIKKCNDERKQ